MEKKEPMELPIDLRCQIEAMGDMINELADKKAEFDDAIDALEASIARLEEAREALEDISC